jgi:GDP-L-fucose synthase
MKKIITGKNGLLGSAFVELMNTTNCNITSYTRDDLNLLDINSVRNKLSSFDEEIWLYNFAAKVGGLYANMNNQFSFLNENLKMSMNIIDVMIERNKRNDKLVQVLSTCIYPDQKYITYPLSENQLHIGPPHTSNYGYAYGKRLTHIYSLAANEQYGCNIVSVIPNNLFGPRDRFSITDGHVIPALIKKILDAKANKSYIVTVLGDGSPLREFTYSHDAAKIVEVVMNEYNSTIPLNIGCTIEYSIREVAMLIAEYLQYDGKLYFDTTKSNGQHRKPTTNKMLLENTNWKESFYTPFKEALFNTCNWASQNYDNLRT